MKSTQMSQSLTNFTDLVAWQEGHKLVLLIYSETSKLPYSERFNLVDQLQRAAVSITSNIAEGFIRQSFKEKVQFMYIALGSVKEAENQLLIAKDLNYISNDQYAIIKGQADSVARLIQGLIKSFKAKS